jgi:hypothetical protein
MLMGRSSMQGEPDDHPARPVYTKLGILSRNLNRIVAVARREPGARAARFR